MLQYSDVDLYFLRVFLFTSMSCSLAVVVFQESCRSNRHCIRNLHKPFISIKNHAVCCLKRSGHESEVYLASKHPEGAIKSRRLDAPIASNNSPKRLC